MAESNATTVIGADTKIKGEMSFESSARILGTVEGQVMAKGTFEVAEGATCRASIEASRVMIDGAVDGNVTATDRVELNAKARLKGDLTAAKLIVTEGASFVGHCRIGPDAIKGSGSSSSEAEVKPNNGQAAKAQPAGRR